MHKALKSRNTIQTAASGPEGSQTVHAWAHGTVHLREGVGFGVLAELYESSVRLGNQAGRGFQSLSSREWASSSYCHKAVE